MSLRRTSSSRASGLVLAALLAVPSTAACQDPKRLEKNVANERAATSEAAAVFFDAKRDEKERLAAVERHAVFFDAAHIGAAKELARNGSATGALRAAALRRISPYVQQDEPFVRAMLSWLVSADEPMELRREALSQAQALLFTTPGTDLRTDILKAMRRTVDSRDEALREGALAALAAEGDEFAQRRLVQGLQDPKDALVPPHRAVELLGLRLKTDHYPVLYRLMKEPPDADTRVACVRLLGGYTKARPDLVAMVQAGREAAALRLAAAQTLNANDPGQFASLMLPVVRDEAAPRELRMYGIQAEMLRREARAAARKDDEFHAAVLRLAGASKDEGVRTAAQAYAERLDAR